MQNYNLDQLKQLSNDTYFELIKVVLIPCTIRFVWLSTRLELIKAEILSFKMIPILCSIQCLLINVIMSFYYYSAGFFTLGWREHHLRGQLEMNII